MSQHRSEGLQLLKPDTIQKPSSSRTESSQVSITSSNSNFRKFQEDDTQIWAINCQQRKESLFSHKIHSDSRNRPRPASVEWGGLRRDRVHRVKAAVYLNGTTSKKAPSYVGDQEAGLRLASLITA
ncbi:hypothetical protein AVEN_60404-1 [Araneus ventricosus]|uniref:Uncharacterized protein n=1 Tax=Araneus ventricosus TaxID=182803 RepID=A0A4Y2H2N6_ARAVE|nr:hypothetical protein AVEN_60404-1 [Araneus ventricosus]